MLIIIYASIKYLLVFIIKYHYSTIGKKLYQEYRKEEEKFSRIERRSSETGREVKEEDRIYFFKTERE
jgi:hypothetical protein